MTNKEYLQQYRLCKVRLCQAKDALAELEEGIDSLAIDYSGMPHGSGTSNKVEAFVVRLEELREPLLKEVGEHYAKMMEVADAVRAIDNETYSQLLHYRYIVGMPWEDVAIQLGYEEGYTRGELHGNALKEVKQFHT